MAVIIVDIAAKTLQNRLPFMIGSRTLEGSEITE
jgi:hypothetical protein